MSRKTKRTAIGKMWRYLKRRKRVPDLPRHFVTGYQVDEMDEDTRLLMMAARSRDPRRVRHLEKLYGARGAELLELLPTTPPPTLLERLAAFGRRIEGSFPYRVTGIRRNIRPSTRSRFYVPLKVEIGDKK